MNHSQLPATVIRVFDLNLTDLQAVLRLAEGMGAVVESSGGWMTADFPDKNSAEHFRKAVSIYRKPDAIPDFLCEL